MISYITGTIQKIVVSKDTYVDILTNGGVGYRISVPSSYIIPAIGEEYSLLPHF